MGKPRMTSVKISETKAGLSAECAWATSAYRRMVGLLSHASLPETESILIEPCKQVHTLFMRFPIDVVFLSASNQVLKIQTLRPWRLSPLVWKAQRVLELPSGRCARAGLTEGAHLEFIDA
ncbi:MAG: DUF192 domain-containing protein [Bdellovibrionota bacterium]